MRRVEQYQDMIARLYPELSTGGNLTQVVTFQVTDACNLCCSYCYQIHKGKRRMSFEVAKKYIDLLLFGEKGFSEYINPEISPGVVIEFIGGEPFMEINLIDQICSYFVNKLIELEHPWATKYMFSICSNGTLYFQPEVQRFLNKWKNKVSFSVTIDGNKELHDSCRIFPDGKGSYDMAIEAAKDWINRGNYMGSKLTIAPGNVTFLYDAVKHMIELGYREINANCVYEEGWTLVHASLFYEEMKRIADYILDLGFDMERDFFLSLFQEDFFRPKAEGDLDNWCGGNGFMISCDPEGKIYPCIRYMESSLGGQQEPYSIGDVEHGICQIDCHKCRVVALKKIDRRTQSTDECFYCPIAEGCSWCTAYNYQIFGTPDARATFICVMHKARALANLYFWNSYYRQQGISKRMVNHVPDEWALEIISEKELLKLKELSEGEKVKK